MMRLYLLLLAAAAQMSPTLGYRILGIFPAPSRSHNQLAKGIVTALLKAGHEVTWATPYPDQKVDKNVTIIDVSATVSLVSEIDMTQHKDDINFVFQFAKNLTTVTIQTKALQDALVKQQFDAVVTEWFFSDTDAGYAAIQQVPWILLSGMTVHPHLENLVDEVRSLSTIPFFMNNFGIPMSFWERVKNVGIFSLMWFGNWFDQQDTIARYEQYFAPLAAARGVALPPFYSALYNISVLLANSHPSVAPAQSLPPNVIDIAGYHIEDSHPPLPKDIQNILDSSPRGVVYFSMGSVLNSSAFEDHLKKDLIKILGELPYTVLWKFEQNMQGLPKNVHIRPWWPQPSVLAHRNIKLFITHGGLLSTLEAVHFGVPLLAIPVFGDQPSNANRAVRNGYALSVPFSTDMGPKLAAALNQMLGDDSYYKQAKYLSKLFNSRPVPPAKLISHYIELAIESKGAYHLRSKTFLYPWYQRWMLDQLAVVLATLYLLKLALQKLCSKVFGNKQRKIKKN